MSIAVAQYVPVLVTVFVFEMVLSNQVVLSKGLTNLYVLPMQIIVSFPKKSLAAIFKSSTLILSQPVIF